MTGQIRDPGIPRSYAEEDLIQTAILAQSSRRNGGGTVSDQAILEFLDGLAANKVPRSEFAGLLRDATGGRLIQLQLFEQLRTELRAQNLRMMANSGCSPSRPVSAWNYFNRLNRRVEAEMLPLPSRTLWPRCPKSRHQPRLNRCTTRARTDIPIRSSGTRIQTAAENRLPVPEGGFRAVPGSRDGERSTTIRCASTTKITNRISRCPSCRQRIGTRRARD
jgi:hypothetical protein